MEETKKEGIVDVTQAYSKIINSIREANHAANQADKAAQHALQVQETLDISSQDPQDCQTPDVKNLSVLLQNVKNQNLSQLAEALKNHSLELKDEVEALNKDLNDGKGVKNQHSGDDVISSYKCVWGVLLQSSDLNWTTLARDWTTSGTNTRT